jgi:hypothetical protein
MIKTYLRYGLIIATSLVAYFLLMKFFGLDKYPVLSAFNAVLFGGGILRAMQTYKRDVKSYNYSDGWQSGFLSGAVATFIFTLFMAVYMYQVDEGFATSILESWGVTYNNGVVMILFSVVLMGLSTSVVLALTFMQLLKESIYPGRSKAL